MIMNKLKYFLSFAMLVVALGACKKDQFNDISFVKTGAAPDKLSALFNITQDNTGLVTITPNGEGATTYDVYFGDGTTTAATLDAGKSVQHKYAEGVYNVKLVGHSINGKTTEATQQLTVSFRAPENLKATVAIDNANNFKVNVSATADYATVFKVYFGDGGLNEVPVSFNAGQTVSHVYAAVGTYTVRVVALSGGAATTEVTKSITIVDPVLLPLDFESPTIKYTFTDFAGGNVTVIDNPQKVGIDVSNKVAKMVKNAGQTYGGSFIHLDQNIDFSTNKVFRMKVYSPRVGAKVLLKVENASDGSIKYEKEVATTKANDWEDLAFDYSGIDASKNYNNIVLIFDNGTMGDGSANFTWLFDDIRQTNTLPSNQLTLPVTFDDPNVTYTTTDFGNAQTVDAVDPSNASNKVKKTTKVNGAQTWAGTSLGAGVGFKNKFAFTSTNAKMTVRVYSPAAGIDVKLKAEDHTDNTKSVETDVLTTVANGWETLTFNFANQSPGTAALNLAYNYDMVSIFFDFGTAGNGKVFYWDDVALAANASTLGLPLDFESSTLNYTFTDFNGGNVTVINNPQKSGIDVSNKVAQMVKNSGATYGGSYITLDNPIDFSTKKTMTMKVYSPRVGAKVLLKVENLTDGSISFQKEVSTTMANSWETLTFDYSAIDASKSYQKVVLIFDNGTVGDGSANFTWLFDDISLN